LKFGARVIHLRIKCILGLFGLLLGLYFSEVVLIVLAPYLRLRCMPFHCDKASISSIILNDRRQGNDIYPAIHPRQFMHAAVGNVGEKSILPLGGISNVPTLLCNERGTPIRYQSGPFGFRNSDKQSLKSVDLLLLGDSFTQGFCVNEEAHFTGGMKGSGYALWNFASSGNGPLAEYATFREYAVEFKPSTTLWFFFEGNDYEDFARELKNPILARYLQDKSFTQNLRGRQRAVDALLRHFADSQLQSYANRGALKNWFVWSDIKRNTLEWLRLYNIRSRLGMANKTRAWRMEAEIAPYSMRHLTEELLFIIKEIEEVIAAWNGKLIFVYLPAWQRFSHGAVFRSHPEYKILREKIIQRDIPFIDIAESFQEHQDPLSLFPGRINLHYNEAGYHIITDKLSAYFSSSDTPHDSSGKDTV